MKRLAIFDMDGTLVDSVQVLAELGIAVMGSAGVEEQTANDVYWRTIGKPFREQLGYLPGARDLDPVVSSHDIERLTMLYERVHLASARLFPLTSLGSSLLGQRERMLFHGWKFALVSSTHKRIIHSMPQLTTLPLDFVMGYFGPGTEKVQQIRTLIETEGYNTSQCCYTGDSPSDRDIAQVLGIRFHDEKTLLTTILSRNESPLESVPSIR